MHGAENLIWGPPHVALLLKHVCRGLREGGYELLVSNIVSRTSYPRRPRIVYGERSTRRRPVSRHGPDNNCVWLRVSCCRVHQ